jgi:hypothetical protein
MMGEEFYCSLKLVSGEEIFSLISIDENDGDPLIILQNPIIMKIINNSKGVFVKIKPWMEIPDDDIFIIKPDKVITMTEISDSDTIQFYEKYVNDSNEEEVMVNTKGKSGQVNISTKMGFVSTVEDARKKLEELFKDNKEA